MNCFIYLNLRNLQEQVKKAFCNQELFWPFTVSINCSSDLRNFENSQPSASNFKSFSQSLEQFFLTVGQNNFGNKIPVPEWAMQHVMQSSGTLFASPIYGRFWSTNLVHIFMVTNLSLLLYFIVNWYQRLSSNLLPNNDHKRFGIKSLQNKKDLNDFTAARFLVFFAAGSWDIIKVLLISWRLYYDLLNIDQ